MLKRLEYLTLALLLSVATARAALPTAVDGALLEAVQKYNSGDVASAWAAFKALSVQAPESDAAYYYLGLCEEARKDFKSAEEHLSRAVELDSTNVWYLNSLAMLYLNAGQRGKAAPLFERLVDARPGTFANAYTLTLAGDSALMRGKDSLSLAYFNQAMAYEPGYVPALMGQAEVYSSQGKYPDFFNTVGRIIGTPQLDPSVKTSYLKELLAHIDGRFYRVWGPQIIKLADTCVELHPDDMSSRELKMELCAIERDTLGLIRQCEEIVSRAQTDTVSLLSALSALGDTWYSKGDRKKAYGYYERALKVNPRFVPVLNNYAYFLCLEKRHLRRALKMSRITIEEEPDNPTYLDTCGWILHLLGKDREAQPLFKRAIIYGGKSSREILSHYAEVLSALGDRKLSSYYSGLAEQK